MSLLYSYTEGVEKACVGVKKNVLADEIAGFGGLNHYFQLISMKYRLNVS
jgi:hypothetical protein